MVKNMNSRIKEAFDTIHAEEELKNRTKDFLSCRTRQYRTVRPFAFRQFAPVFACLFVLLFCFGGYRLYITPTSVISIDINPSLELGINRFDRVVSVDGYNDDGETLVLSLNVRHMEYTEAIRRILAEKSVADCLEQDGLLSIVVVGSDDEKSSRMVSDIEFCVGGHGNACCSFTGTEEVAAAHTAGLSYGKYRAFLEVQKHHPEITAEEIQKMTMREIQDILDGGLPHHPEEGGSYIDGNGDCTDETGNSIDGNNGYGGGHDAEHGNGHNTHKKGK